MGVKESCKYYCCTWEGLAKAKHVGAFASGALVIATGVLTMIGNFAFPPFLVIRSIWNIIFGIMMLALQLKMDTFITKRFGFLKHWFLRGMFYLFVGTNVMTCGDPCSASDVFSVFVGCICLFVGCMELLFGAKCAKTPEEGAEMEGAASGPAPGRAQIQTGSEGPSLTVNVTPAQAMQGASWAAKNAPANQGGGSSSGGGGGSDNPFFGNSHLGK